MDSQDKKKSKPKKGILGFPKKSKILFIVNVSFLNLKLSSF
jgi:hypothetical protein